MKGKPKFKLGDTVSFNFAGRVKTGKIVIVDANGTFEDDSDVSYDIEVPIEGWYKHVNEKLVYENA